MCNFELVIHSPVLIYGAGMFGQKIYHKIKDIYKIEGFIDRNVRSIDGIEVAVYDLEHIAEFHYCSVIVCTHNANWHYEIAEDLYAKGFEKIIFLAMSDNYPEKKAIQMNRIYNYFLEEEYSCLCGIPCYQDMKERNFTENIIRENKEYVVVWCGKELLYSYNKFHDYIKIDGLPKLYLDVPIIAYEPCTSLFRFFMNAIEGDVEKFVEVGRKVDNSFETTEEEFLNSQYDTYQLLEKTFEKGVDACQYMPIDVKWNPRGYFNLIDGHHRCAFYWLKGLQSMPVRMKRKDYEIWMNQPCFDKVKTLLKEEGGEQILPSVKIAHPVLQGYTCRYAEYGTTILDILTEWLYKEGLNFQSILEVSDYQGFYGRNFFRMKKAEQIVSVVQGDKEIKLAKAIAELQYIPDDAIKILSSLDEAIERNQTFEVGMLCGVYSIEELEINLDKLNNCLTNILFWQSKLNSQAEKEYILKYSDFHHYKDLATRFVNGRLCEIGVFVKG